MKAIRVHKAGGPEELKYEDAEIRKPGKGEVLVRVKAAGVNFVDINMRKGVYPPSGPYPYIPGLEGSGVIEALGEDAQDAKVGDRIAFVHQPFTYAENCIIKIDSIIPISEDMSFEQAAAFPLQGMTAHYLIHDFRKLNPGETVLIHAAAGGVGRLLVQWAHKKGIKVIGTVSTDEKAKIAKEAGADEIINYKNQNFVEEVKRLTNGQGVHLVLDAVGKTTFPGSLECAAKRGSVVIYGSASGPADPIAPNSLMGKSISVSGGSLGNFISNRNDLLRRARDILQGIKEGWLKLSIQALPLAKAAEAHRKLENRETTGKIVLISN